MQGPKFQQEETIHSSVPVVICNVLSIVVIFLLDVMEQKDYWIVEIKSVYNIIY